MLRLIRRGGPALCNVAVTNSCNATCDFCNFANGKVGRKDLRWIDADQFDAALQILHTRGIRYVSFFGGEPLLHARLSDMIAMAVAKGMGPALITNGWLLPSKLDQLARAGLKTVYVSIDQRSRRYASSVQQRDYLPLQSTASGGEIRSVPSSFGPR